MNESVRFARLEEKMAENEEWLVARVSGRHFDAVNAAFAAAHRIQKSC